MWAPRPGALCRLPGSHPWEERSTLAPPVLPATPGILRPPCRSWDCVPLCHPSTFKPGTSPTIANFKVQILCSTASAGSLPASAATAMSPQVNFLKRHPHFRVRSQLPGEIPACRFPWCTSLCSVNPFGHQTFSWSS